MIQNEAQVLDNIKKYGTKAEKSAISTLNKTATVLRNKSVDIMQKQVAVSRARLLKQVKRLPKAKVGRMQTGIITEHRGVQLRNFPHQATSEGVKVKISPTGGYKLIKGAFIGKKPLRGSGITGYIAMRNNDLIRMLKRTPTIDQDSRNRRIASIKRRFKYGISPLYSTSENQMLYDIKERDDLSPTLLTTMQNEFLTRFKNDT